MESRNVAHKSVPTYKSASACLSLPVVKAPTHRHKCHWQPTCYTHDQSSCQCFSCERIRYLGKTKELLCSIVGLNPPSAITVHLPKTSARNRATLFLLKQAVKHEDTGTLLFQMVLYAV